MKIIGAIVSILLLAGCSTVYTREPVGDKPTNIAAEHGDWSGVWIGENIALTVQVRNAEKGILNVASVDENSSGDLELETHEILLRDHNGWTFVNLKSEDDKDLYNWMRITRRDKVVFLWYPDLEKMKQLVSTGKLPGKMQDDNVILEKLGTRELDLITSETLGVPFVWDEPLILRKQD